MFKLTPFTNTPRRRDELSDFNNLIDDFFNAPFRSLRHDTFKLDVKEEDNQYIIEADLPGINRNEIKVSYDDQHLIIAIERDEEKEDKQENYLHRERQVCSMRRVINLPDVDKNHVKAKLEDGVLRVSAQKTTEEETSHLIDVE